MVKASCPIHGNICLLLVQLHSTGCREKNYKMLAKEYKMRLTSLHLLAVLRHVIRANRSQKFYVVITVVLGHFFCVCLVRTLQGQKEIVGHPDPVGFHWMSLAIIPPPVFHQCCSLSFPCPSSFPSALQCFPRSLR
uniref:Uncharacterized protein n=1 Tax=Dromaius novaehollandiae TaxID=8790 RepID=A0A8C4JW49_DRONO